MVKSVFITENGNMTWISAVYNEVSLHKIRQYAEIHPVTMGKDNLEEHKPYLREVEVIFSTWGMPSFTEQEIEQHFPRLKAVFYAAGSVQAFARPFLNKDRMVISAWAANAVPVAEYTTAQILLANKGYYQNMLKAKSSYSSARDYSSSFPGNYGAKVGILGVGMIGKKVIELLQPFNMEVWVYDPFLPEEATRRLHVRKAGLVEIFSKCQTISNHIANLPATVGMINKQHFDVMLPNATFINTGRGAQVVESDLFGALNAMPGRTALLDVTDPEPPAADCPFLQMDNVFLTTHIAGSMGMEVQRMGEFIADEFVRYNEGTDLKYQVTLPMLETMA